MSPWRLLWVVPVATGIGWMVAARLAWATCADCPDAHRLHLELSKAKEFEAGFAQGLAQLDKVG